MNRRSGHRQPPGITSTTSAMVRAVTGVKKVGTPARSIVRDGCAPLALARRRG
jgi:hypothetical protein